jgi:hypothetical protein
MFAMTLFLRPQLRCALPLICGIFDRVENVIHHFNRNCFGLKRRTNSELHPSKSICNFPARELPPHEYSKVWVKPFAFVLVVRKQPLLVQKLPLQELFFFLHVQHLLQHKMTVDGFSGSSLFARSAEGSQTEILVFCMQFVPISDLLVHPPWRRHC